MPHNTTHTRGIVHIVRERYVFQGGHDLINSHYILQVGEAAAMAEAQFLRLIMCNAPWKDNTRSLTFRPDGFVMLIPGMFLVLLVNVDDLLFESGIFTVLPVCLALKGLIFAQ